MKEKEVMTQKKAIVQYCIDNGSISSWEAYQHLGITQLATRISELKEKGYVFDKTTETKEGRYGRKVHFDHYKIVKAGEQL